MFLVRHVIQSVSALTVFAFLLGCSQSYTAPPYRAGSPMPRAQLYDSTTYKIGRVVGSQQVAVQGARSGAGAGLGSFVGVYANQSNNIWSLLGTGIAGGLVGSAVEEGLTAGSAYEYTVMLNDGSAMITTQLEFYGLDQCVQVRSTQRTELVTLVSTSESVCKYSLKDIQYNVDNMMSNREEKKE